MKPWHSSLLKEYREGRKQLGRMANELDDELETDKEDKKIINSAIRDMDFTIKWLDTGIMPELKRKRYRAYTHQEEFVYGVNGYWDDSINAFVSQSSYIDPYEEVEDRIDRELEVKRREASRTHRKSK